MGDDDIDTSPDKLSREFRSAVASNIGIEELDCDVLAFRVISSPRRKSSANGYGGDADTNTPTSGNFPGCCARAASGRAAAPLMSVMNSRLLS
jgi:hypothetical protein